MRKLSVVITAFVLFFATTVYTQNRINFGRPVNSYTDASVVVGNGTAFALPQSDALTITWQTDYTVAPGSVTIQLQASLDGTNYASIDSHTNLVTTVKTTGTSARFIRCSVTAETGDGTGFDCIINVARGGGGGGAGGTTDVSGLQAVLGATTDPTITPGDGGTLASFGRTSTSILNDIKTSLSGLAADVGHDNVLPGTPTGPLNMLAAVAFGSTPTAVAASDAVKWNATRAGIPFVQPGHPNPITLEAQIEDADGAQTNAAIITVSAGTRIAVMGVAANCDASTTGPTNILIGFGTATLPARAHTGVAGILGAFDGTPAGGGKVKGFNGGLIGVGADDEDVRITTEDPVGGACTIEVSYYTIAG